jgi:hypothetical protein
LLRGLLHAQLLLCDVSVFIIIMYAACTHTLTTLTIYTLFCSPPSGCLFIFSEFHFFNTYIHLHKRHHRNAEQNAPLCLSSGAYRQSAGPAVDVREMSKLFSGGANRP